MYLEYYLYQQLSLENFRRLNHRCFLFDRQPHPHHLHHRLQRKQCLGKQKEMAKNHQQLRTNYRLSHDFFLRLLQAMKHQQ